MALTTAVPRIHLVMSGNLPAGEIWQSGFWLDNQAAPVTDRAVLQAWLDSVGPNIVTAYQTGIRQLLSTGGSLTAIKAYWYAVGATKATLIANRVVTGAPGTGTQTMPDQCALVTSLLSSVAGRRFRGRMYWPCLTQALTSGQLGTSDVDVVAEATRQIISAAAAGAIGSGRALPAVGDGVAITSVATDSVVDTQRRRRNSIRPAYRKVVAVPVT